MGKRYSIVPVKPFPNRDAWNYQVWEVGGPMIAVFQGDGASADAELFVAAKQAVELAPGEGPRR